MSTMSTTEPSTELAGPQVRMPDTETLADRMFGAALGSLELGTIHLGLRLGLYATLHAAGPLTASELADAARIDARYAREWLEQQAVAQLLTCPNPGADPEDRRYTLPPASAEVLLDAASPAFLGPIAQLAVGTMRASRDLEHAYRTAGGVSFARYGDELRHGLGVMNGATFDRDLPSWIAAMPDVERRLHGDVQPRILDLGCGVGRSALALARAFPTAQVRGIDLDRASVDEARHAAAEAGLADRVTFAYGDAADRDPSGSFDLITILEALHDMGDPVVVLTTAKRSLREGGAVLIADQLTRDTFLPDGDPMERFQYGCSVLHCLPATRAEDHVVAHGTVIRAETVRAWAQQAGFGSVEVLDLEDPFWRFYRL